jgi:hypothetical protein
MSSNKSIHRHYFGSVPLFPCQNNFHPILNPSTHLCPLTIPSGYFRPSMSMNCPTYSLQVFLLLPRTPTTSIFLQAQDLGIIICTITFKMAKSSALSCHISQSLNSMALQFQTGLSIPQSTHFIIFMNMYWLTI